MSMFQTVRIGLDNNDGVVGDDRPLPGIDYVHDRVHEGRFWTASQAASMTTQSYYVHVRTPNITTQHHLTFSVDANLATTGGMSVSFYKSPTTHTLTAGTGTGPAITLINKKLDDVVYTTTAKFFGNSTYESSLTSTNLLETQFLSSSNVHGSFGYQGNTRSEYILAANSNYTLKVNCTASSAVAHINFGYYTQD